VIGRAKGRGADEDGAPEAGAPRGLPAAGADAGKNAQTQLALQPWPLSLNRSVSPGGSRRQSVVGAATAFQMAWVRCGTLTPMRQRRTPRPGSVSTATVGSTAIQPVITMYCLVMAMARGEIRRG